MIRTDTIALPHNTNQKKVKEKKKPNRLKSIAKGLAIGSGIGLLGKTAVRASWIRSGHPKFYANKMSDMSRLIKIGGAMGGILGGTTGYAGNERNYEKQQLNKQMDQLRSESYKNRSRQQRLRDVFR